VKRALSLAAALLLAGGLWVPAVARAQSQVIVGHEMSDADINKAELNAFDQVATANLKMSRRLTANPRLANSDSFLRRWRDLANFFSKYPGSKERFLENPGNYLPDVDMHHAHSHGYPMMTVREKKEAPESAASPTPSSP